MHLTQLTIENFRNLQPASIAFQSGLNVFIGNNGQGKTNLMEAIQMLTSGVSFRPGKSETFIHHGSKHAFVQGNVEKSVGMSGLQLILTPTGRKWQFNGKPSSGLAMGREFPCVLFSPDSLSVIKSGPDSRREFLDETLASFSDSHFRALEDFQRALRSRNKILRDARLETLPISQAHALLDSIEIPFLTAASSLTQARLETIRALQGDFNQMVHKIDPKLIVDVSVEYLVSDQPANDWNLEQIDAALRKRARELRTQELAVGHSLVGPHKHDVRILYGGNDSRFWCSQGQQRALILSFKLARIVYHYRVHNTYPFLLLDDVLSELDSEKRENLVSALSRMHGQIFMTSTELTLPPGFSTLPQAVFQVRSGAIERLS
jgi:DNA replication and repair protein RecF